MVLLFKDDLCFWDTSLAVNARHFVPAMAFTILQLLSQEARQKIFKKFQNFS